jgi:hypothetical protein
MKRHDIINAARQHGAEAKAVKSVCTAKRNVMYREADQAIQQPRERIEAVLVLQERRRQRFR